MVASEKGGEMTRAQSQAVPGRNAPRREIPSVFTGRGLGLFLWEYFVIAAICFLFILFAQSLVESRNERTIYSFYLFHVVFPPIVFGLVTWATGSFRPGRMLCAAVLGALTLFAFFPMTQVLASLWILMLCLNLAFLFQLVGVPKPARGKRKVTMSADPVEENPDLRRSMDNDRRRLRKNRTSTKHARPIPLSRFWPNERI